MRIVHVLWFILERVTGSIISNVKKFEERTCRDLSIGKYLAKNG